MSSSRAIWLVAQREVVERVRDRSFTISIAVFVGLIAAFVYVPRLLGWGGPEDYRIGSVDQESAALAQALSDQAGDQAEVELRSFDDLALAEAALADGELTAVLASGEVIVDSELPGELDALIQRASAQRQVLEGFGARGVSGEEVNSILNPDPLPVRTLEPGADPTAADASVGLAIIVVLVLYGQLLGYGIGVASGIVEEKQTRVVEVLLSTLSPAQLLAGKVAGIGVVGLLQLAIQAGLALALVVLTGAVDLPPDALGVLGWTLAWFVLGYAFYASAFAIVGAICARQEELQNAATPLSLVMLASLFIASGSNGDPSPRWPRSGRCCRRRRRW